MRVGFIGAGLMGKTMGVLLSRCGYELSGYFSRSETTACRVAKEVGGKFYSDMAKLAANCDVLFITTPDDAIEQVALTLGELKCLGPGQYLVHMSGCQTSKILLPALAGGASGFSMHPLQSCASLEEALISLPLSVFSLEGDPEGLRIGKTMVSRIGAEYFVLSTEDKILYHAAACTASNYLVTLFDAARKLLELAGVDSAYHVPALSSLMLGTISNLKALTPEQALTGPIARGDTGTVAAHLKALGNKVPELVDLYKTLGRRTLKLAQEKGKLNPDKLEAMTKLLE